MGNHCPEKKALGGLCPSPWSLDSESATDRDEVAPTVTSVWSGCTSTSSGVLVLLTWNCQTAGSRPDPPGQRPRAGPHHPRSSAGGCSVKPGEAPLALGHLIPPHDFWTRVPSKPLSLRLRVRAAPAQGWQPHTHPDPQLSLHGFVPRASGEEPWNLNPGGQRYLKSTWSPAPTQRATSEAECGQRCRASCTAGLGPATSSRAQLPRQQMLTVSLWIK